MGARKIAQGKRGQESLAPPWVGVPAPILLLSPSPPESRERSGEEALVTEWQISRFVVLRIFLARSMTFQMSRVSPHPDPLPQHRKRVGGEGRNCENADPGRRTRLLPRACPGLQSAAPVGLYEDEAASCRFKCPISTSVAGGYRRMRARRPRCQRHGETFPIVQTPLKAGGLY